MTLLSAVGPAATQDPWSLQAAAQPKGLKALRLSSAGNSGASCQQHKPGSTPTAVAVACTGAAAAATSGR